jgi:hypothetical protein
MWRRKSNGFRLRIDDMARARGEVTAKPHWDAYGGMLVLSLLAMIGGIVLLYMDYAQYPDGKPPMPVLKSGGGAAAPGGAPPANPPVIPPEKPPEKPPGR